MKCRGKVFLKLFQYLVFDPKIFVPIFLKVICATKTFGDAALKKKSMKALKALGSGLLM